jgi:phosphoglycolate phosphatase-like HAD superfamily hydrolase
LILLFDIDGTLLQGHGVGRRALEAALLSLYGQTFDTTAIPFSGKTDPQIFREILTAAPDFGLTEATPDDRQCDAFRDAYLNEMSQRLPVDRVSELPGAATLVRQLDADGHTMGLLTGNLEPLAYGKVARIGLDAPLFPFGAFGSDHEDRNALPAIAAERAGTHLRRDVPHTDLVIIGDTPRDIECARAVGARAVAVATGYFTADELADADIVLESLEAFETDAMDVLRVAY